MAAGIWIIRDIESFQAEDSVKAMRVNYEGAANVVDAVSAVHAAAAAPVISRRLHPLPVTAAYLGR